MLFLKKNRFNIKIAYLLQIGYYPVSFKPQNGYYTDPDRKLY